MSLHLIALVLIPLVVGIVGRILWPDKVTWKEMAGLVVIGCLVVWGAFAAVKWGALRDVEHWNGRITSKDHGSQGCCHCRTVCDARDKKGNCTRSHTVCDHLRDYWWAVSVSTGDKIFIDSCEPHESDVPAAWTNAVVGEPASVEHSYMNYLLADPDSLMRRVADPTVLKTVPSFPKIHDFWKVSKVVNAGASLPPEWDAGLFQLNADLGGAKQVDVVLVATDKADPEWAVALEAKWLYGPKNSVNIVVGVKDGEFKWVRVVTVSRVEELKIALRDGLQGIKVGEWEKGLAVIRENVGKKFKRTPMAEWEYLYDAASPPTWALVLLYLFAVGLSAGLVAAAKANDVFGDEWKSRAAARINPKNWRK